jgi:hypothetical protein
VSCWRKNRVLHPRLPNRQGHGLTGAGVAGAAPLAPGSGVCLRSPAGKAHPFKGGMKGGLAFFLKA